MEENNNIGASVSLQKDGGGKLSLNKPEDSSMATEFASSSYMPSGGAYMQGAPVSDGSVGQPFAAGPFPERIDYGIPASYPKEQAGSFAAGNPHMPASSPYAPQPVGPQMNPAYGVGVPAYGAPQQKNMVTPDYQIPAQMEQEYISGEQMRQQTQGRMYNVAGTNQFPVATNMQREFETPVSIEDWLVALLVQYVPLVNIIMLFVWAFSGDGEASQSKQNWAKAMLILKGIGVGLGIFGVIFAGRAILRWFI